ncbi:putative molybdenum cofactor biosynthesis protein D/E [Candidatus Promineifilum breve]|uniref:Molybdenum cofactor biosynthesis protein D/E n=1 Tax=Candidatus Promineifilum breve TaxID=1806508 RepID=A0A170PHR5_9CHLR|nr:molybdenum cofactor biosynthesis protein MoaE [Candidatus Promineifilum breve]CUS04457.2 putative molybdenum cofactor biosynthesis protein D/E [Candidatus Promineifilum breve]
MEIEIRLFATLKDRAGSDRIRVRLPADPTTVGLLLEAVGADYPALAPALRSALVAVNRAFAGSETPVTLGDEVAIFPPVSGGQTPFPPDESQPPLPPGEGWAEGQPPLPPGEGWGEGQLPLPPGEGWGEGFSPHPTYFAITTAPLDIEAIHAHLSGPEIGAIVSFTGFVRGRTQRDGLPPATLHLDYEAYESMAEEKMAQIAREMWARWPEVRGVALVQRLGRLGVGQTTTFVACAGAHRDVGVFEAARYGIDRLKEIVPVWKKEVGADRSVWVEGQYRPTENDNEKR